MTSLEWVQKLLNILCALFGRWGQSCANLPGDPADRSKAVNAYYRDNGPPHVAERAETLEQLDKLELHLADAANPLDAEIRQLLASFIADVRADCE